VHGLHRLSANFYVSSVADIRASYVIPHVKIATLAFRIS